MNPINRDVTDSRDLINYKEQLENDILGEYQEWVENNNKYCDEGQELEMPDCYEEIEYVDEESFTETCAELIQEYEQIKDFCNELEYCTSEFKHGETIIHENYFQEYCEEFVKECGYISDNIPSIIENNIDWSGIADDMEQDYSRVTYQSEDYLIRSY